MPDKQEKVKVRAGDFRQCLDVLLMTEEGAREVATKLHGRFDGDLARLPGLLQLLEDRWGFPHRVFPLLRMQIRRTRGGADDRGKISETEWANAFVRWLQVLQVRCSQTKVSRQCFVQTKSNRDWAELYFRGDKLGEGSYGEVHLALHTGLKVARVVKSVPKAQLGMEAEQVEDEVAALKAMDHPHIVRIFEAFETDESLHIVMDYAEGGDLSSAIREMQRLDRTLPKPWVRAAAGQVASALAYMHSKAVIHCDLKPQNSMLLRKFILAEVEAGRSDPHVLLVDFGLAEIFEESPTVGQQNRVKGSPFYLSPEAFDGRLSHKSDMWSFGVMLFEMLVGQRPYKGSNMFLVFCAIMKEALPVHDCPEEARGLVKALLTKDPVERISAEQCLQNDWFAEWFSSEGQKEKTATEAASNAGLPKELGHASYFYRAVMFCVASALGMKDVRILYEAFQLMDTDRSGYLTKQTLSKGLDRLGIQQDPMATMACLDLDQDEQISLTEFLAGAVRIESEVSEPMLRYAFATFDADGDGYISRLDLQEVLAAEGTSADMLPDGLTIEQVMEEVSRGEGRISFESFYVYMKRAATQTKKLMRHTSATDISIPASKTVLVEDLLGATWPTAKEMVQHLAVEVDSHHTPSDTTIKEEETLPKFPLFHQWLNELYHDTQEGASWSRLLVFQDRMLEASYVAWYLRETCQRIALLALGLLLYTIWAVTTENEGWVPYWSPSISRWDSSVRVANNLAWIALGVLACLTIFLCGLSATMHKETSAERLGKRALFFEYFISSAGCLLPWICCCFASRRRVAALFGVEARDVFPSMSSDYDLMVVMLWTLMYITTLTHVRLASTVLIAISCVLAYSFTTVWLGMKSSAMQCETDENWIWPALLLVLVSAFNLWGHRTVEKHRRLTFLSLHASYVVLKETNECGMMPLATTSSGLSSSGKLTHFEPENETQYARFAKTLRVLERLTDNMEVNRPLRAALSSLVEMLSTMKDDVAQVDRLHTSDVATALNEKGVSGGAQHLLCGLLDAWPPHESTAAEEIHRMTLQRLNQEARKLEKEIDNIDGPKGAWGWDVLSSRADEAWPLAAAGKELIEPAVAEAAAAGWAATPQKATLARTRAGVFMEGIAHAYANGTHTAECRAALTLRAAHWLAHRLGLWAKLTPWERVAMLLAAVGLNCGVGGVPREQGGALVSRAHWLAHAASMDLTLKILDVSRLAEVAVGGFEEPVPLRQMVDKLLARMRPQTVLHDAYISRVRLEHDDSFPIYALDRARLSAVVLAAADTAFLALPGSLHVPWARLCKEEAAEILAGEGSSAMVDVSLWLQGLTEMVALPLYETLGKIEGAADHLSAPLKHLRANLKQWKVTDLVAAPAAPGTTPGIDGLQHPFEVPVSPQELGGGNTAVAGNGQHRTPPLLPVPARAGGGAADTAAPGPSDAGGSVAEEAETKALAASGATASARLPPRLAHSKGSGEGCGSPAIGYPRAQAVPVAAEEPKPRDDEQPLTSEKIESDMSMSLSQALLMLKGEDSTNVSSIPSAVIDAIAAEASQSRIPSKSSQNGRRRSGISALELPALPGDEEGFTVTATEDVISKSMGPGAIAGMMTMRPGEREATPASPSQPLSARGKSSACGPRGAGKVPPRTPQPVPPSPQTPQPPLNAWASTGNLAVGTSPPGPGEHLRDTASAGGVGIGPLSPDDMPEEPGGSPPPPSSMPRLLAPAAAASQMPPADSGRAGTPGGEAKEKPANFHGTLQNLLESVLDT